MPPTLNIDALAMGTVQDLDDDPGSPHACWWFASSVRITHPQVWNIFKESYQRALSRWIDCVRSHGAVIGPGGPPEF